MVLPTPKTRWRTKDAGRDVVVTEVGGGRVYYRGEEQQANRLLDDFLSRFDPVDEVADARDKSTSALVFEVSAPGLVAAMTPARNAAGVRELDLRVPRRSSTPEWSPCATCAGTDQVCGGCQSNRRVIAELTSPEYKDRIIKRTLADVCSTIRMVTERGGDMMSFTRGHSHDGVIDELTKLIEMMKNREKAPGQGPFR